MSNRQGAPTSPELEEKKRLVERLQAEKAAKEKQIKDLEGNLRAQKQEVTAALHYLDKLAKDHQEKLKELQADKTHKAQAQAKRIEAKLALYKSVRAAAGKFEDTMGTGNLNSFASTALSLRLAESEAVIANAKLVLDDLSESIDVLKSAVGQPVRLAPNLMPAANAIKARVHGNPQLHQQVNAAIHFYQETGTATQQEELNLNTLRGMTGKEAVQFAANTMKISSLAGKVNNLRNLYQTFSKEPAIKPLFPEPIAITIPRLPPGMTTQKNEAKPLTGVLMDLLGLGKKS